jgi:hypothetical protein
MREFFASVDTALIGRKTHDQMVAWGHPAYAGMENHVFSRTRRADDGVPVRYVSADLDGFVGQLRRKPGKDLWLVGGGGLIAEISGSGARRSRDGEAVGGVSGPEVSMPGTPSRALLTVPVLLSVLWCSTGATGPSAVVQEVVADSVLLAPGQEATAGILRLTFVGVASDSRCPTDVMCVWAGNAAVEITLRLGEGPGHPYTLNTGIEPDAVDSNGFRVTLLDVQPAPRTERPIAPADYRARFRVETLADSL